MDRRATLNTLLGRSKKAVKTAATAAVTAFDTYEGPWTYSQAAHLLRRGMFGPTHAQIKTAVDNGLEATLMQLFAPQPLPSPPVNYEFEDDPNVPIGETWIEAPYSTTVNLTPYRARSLRAWTMGQIINSGVSIREKMVLFWHNHFVTANINDQRYVYLYSNLLRENALGNFRDLVKAITIDPSMLRYLNGSQNTKEAPNENYARELLELFTIGKGDAVGPGDYTNYTEDDVVAIARVLTGWRDVGFNSIQAIPIDSVFIPNRHDEDDKQLSFRFDNVVISNAGDQEYSNLIDIIFQKDEVARFICRKLYRWFVYYDIPEEVELNIIEPMAQVLINNDYEIAPALMALLSSEHFYEEDRLGCMIKNPVDYVFTLINQFEMPFPDNFQLEYTAWLRTVGGTILLQMEYYNPPSVAGWKAYYQEPAFYQMWINSVTLPLRTQIAQALLFTGLAIPGDQDPMIDPIAFLEKVDDPSEINSMLADFVRILLPKPLAQNQMDYLKQVVLQGLPDFEWNVEYAEYLDNPDDPGTVNSIRNKLLALLNAIMTLPEYQLS